MLLVEAFFKFTTIGLLLAIGLLIWRDARGVRALRFGLPLCLALICTFLTTGSEQLSITNWVAVPLRLYDMLNPLFIWWLGLSLFDDDFEIGPIESVLALFFIVCMAFSRLHYLGFDTWFHSSLVLISSALTIGFMLHLAYRAIAGRQEDLVEQRRIIRVRFAVAIATVLFASAFAERVAQLLGTQQEQTIWITYVFSLPIVIWSILWLTRLHPEVLALAHDQAINVDPDAMDYKERGAYEKLLSVMLEEKPHHNHGLSIGDLSELVGLPSHQLRKLINNTMGYRNFSSFLNSYRIAAVKELLADPSHARTPILTLALECGFSSLAPFNRAFKAFEGVTPSEFRVQTLTPNQPD